MNKEIRTVDREHGIVQITTVDSRWYVRPSNNKKTGLPEYEFVPSVTWITDHWPKSIAFYRWLADKGWSQAEQIKQAAGDKGSKVHQAVNDLINGNQVNIDSKYENPTTGEKEELSSDEYEAIVSFSLWHLITKPQAINSEFVVWGDGYAGTIDLFCIIGDQQYLVDFKTSQNIWPSHELQLSAYLHAMNPSMNTKLAILQLGYNSNKVKYKFTEIEDQYQEFLAAKLIWAKEQKGIEPKQIELPLSVRLKAEKEGENDNTRAAVGDGKK